MTAEELQAKFAARFPRVEKVAPGVKGFATLRLPDAGELPAVARWLKEDLGFLVLEMATAVDWLGPVQTGGLAQAPNPHAFGAEPAPQEAARRTSGVDYRDKIELVYCLSNPQSGREKVFLKVDVPREGGRAPSLTGLFKGADWQEREIFDLFGVAFDGHPNLKKILTPAFIQGYPLRKDYAHVKDRFD